MSTPPQLKILGVVVTYYPVLSEVINNIKLYIDHIDHLIFWINTPGEDSSTYNQIGNILNEKISFMGVGKNVGIGYALNQAIKYGLANGYTHLLTMDQDSVWIDFGKYAKLIQEYATSYHIFAPTITTALESQSIQENKPFVSEVMATITSGTVYSLQLFKSTGGFNEGYFIDAVDTEYGYRAYRQGYPTAKFSNIFLLQNIGTLVEKGSLKTISYSSFRIYHIMRNHLWLWRQHSHIIPIGMKKWIIFSFLLRRIPKIILLEDNKTSKLRNLFQGLWDGLFSKCPSAPNI